jgi:hypothetical protein
MAHRWPAAQRPVGAALEHGCVDGGVGGAGVAAHGLQLALVHVQSTPHVHAACSAAQFAVHAVHAFSTHSFGAAHVSDEQPPPPLAGAGVITAPGGDGTGAIGPPGDGVPPTVGGV